VRVAHSKRVDYRLTVNSRLGYLFERFPAFTQTFCARELAELYRQGVTPPVFSIRRPIEERPLNIPLNHIPIHYLPDTNSLRFKLKTKLISSRTKHLWSGSGDLRDKGRFREAVYLAPLLRRADVSHVHVHFAGLASRSAWWLKRLYGFSYSFTGHANDIFCPKPNQRVDLADLLDDASFVVSVSDYSVKRLSQSFPQAAGKIHRVYNGVDLSIFKQVIPSTGPIRLLSIGRLIEKKGFIFLIKACQLLRDRGFDFECKIVGDGPERAPLLESIQTNQVSKHVHLTGPMSQPEIVDLLAQSSIFVFPAIHDRFGDTDNLPTVLIEAMASRLSLIATDVAGISEIVHHKKNGILVPEKDPMQLADAIELLGSNRSLLNQYGQMSRQIAEQKFSLSTTIPELKRIFGQFNLLEPVR
jgi:colanic acid/amylovoran biosynthesis glycosyltransferase